jgi:hypothetical protein
MVLMIKGALYLVKRRRDRLAAEARADEMRRSAERMSAHYYDAALRGAADKARRAAERTRVVVEERKRDEQPSTISPLLAGAIGYELGRMGDRDECHPTAPDQPAPMPESDGRFGGAGASASFDSPQPEPVVSEPEPVVSESPSVDSSPSYDSSPSFDGGGGFDPNS